MCSEIIWLNLLQSRLLLLASLYEYVCRCVDHVFASVYFRYIYQISIYKHSSYCCFEYRYICSFHCVPVSVQIVSVIRMSAIVYVYVGSGGNAGFSTCLSIHWLNGVISKYRYVIVTWTAIWHYVSFQNVLLCFLEHLSSVLVC